MCRRSGEAGAPALSQRETHLRRLATQVRDFVDEQQALARARAAIRHADQQRGYTGANPVMDEAGDLAGLCCVRGWLDAVSAEPAGGSSEGCGAVRRVWGGIWPRVVGRSGRGASAGWFGGWLASSAVVDTWDEGPDAEDEALGQFAELLAQISALDPTAFGDGNHETHLWPALLDRWLY